MSQIWDWLKDIDRRQVSNSTGGQANARHYERRSTERLRVSIPVFVYGYTSMREPFYEPSELTSVNALGGLITLHGTVASGQKLLLLTCKDTEREVGCDVVGLRSSKSNQLAVAIAFERPMPNVWGTGGDLRHSDH